MLPHLDPHPVPLSALVTVAGRRWTSAEAFQAGKGLTAFDAHQVRRWTCGRGWTVLAMLAHAFLAITAATNRQHHQHQPDRNPDQADLRPAPPPPASPDPETSWV